MSDELEALRADVHEVKSRQEIKELKYEYFHTVDVRDPEAFTELFTEDAVLDIQALDDPWGRYEGHEEIRECIELLIAQFDLELHFGINPVIEVDGETATGRWYFFGTFVFADTEYVDPMDAWETGIYHEKYRQVDGEWKFEEVFVDTVAVFPYDEGFSAAESHGDWTEIWDI
jgi:ketosteroid isomerase-like protein